MKNIFILPTDQPSKLAFDTDENFYLLCEEPVFFKHQELVENRNIYITSDEEIKKDEYYLGDDNHIYNLVTSVNNNGKKIILTTDPTLIEDGVQSIDDEFLEWFVKNSSCEFVEIQCRYNFYAGYDLVHYKIIIPQEEPKGEKKPHSFCETPEEKCTMNYCDDNGCQNRKRHLVEPHEQEILPEFTLSKNIFDKISDLPKGETSYSEDEVLELLKKSHFVEQNIEEWFNQNKKK